MSGSATALVGALPVVPAVVSPSVRMHGAVYVRVCHPMIVEVKSTERLELPIMLRCVQVSPEESSRLIGR